MIARLALLAVTVLQGFHIQPLHNLMHEEAQMLLAQHVPYIGGQKPCLPRIVGSKFRHTSFSLSFKHFSREMFGVLTQTLKPRVPYWALRAIWSASAAFEALRPIRREASGTR